MVRGENAYNGEMEEKMHIMERWLEERSGRKADNGKRVGRGKEMSFEKVAEEERCHLKMLVVKFTDIRNYLDLS